MNQDHHPTQTQLLNHSMGRPIEEALSRHIDGCPACQRTIEQLVRERTELAQHLKPRRLLARQTPHRSATSRRPAAMRWLPAAAAVLALITSLLAVHLTRPEGARLKGAISIQVYVKRGGRVVRADDAFCYRPSDKIRLGVLTPRPARVTVLALEPEGYQAVPGLENVAVTAGEERVLPGSLSLDCDRGSETLRLELRHTSDGPPATRTLVFRCEQP